MSEDPFGGWGMDLPDPGRALAMAALGVSHARWTQDGGTGAPDLQQLQAALQAVVDTAGPEGAPMVRWEVAGDLGFLTGVPAAAMAQSWWEKAPRLRRSVRREDPQPLRLEVELSPATEPYAAWISAQLVGSAEWAVGVHMREDRPTPAPRWHWPLRVRCLDDPLSETLASALRNTYPCGMGLADVLLRGEARRPAELLVLPWSLPESVGHVTAANLQAPVACVVVLGGGQDLPWPELRVRKDELLAATGAAGVYVSELDPEQVPEWFSALGFNLAHNYQLDVAITSAWYGPNPAQASQLVVGPASAGVFFATSELLAVSQLSSQVAAMAEGFASLPDNPIIEVPGGLGIAPSFMLAKDLARQIREKAPGFGYEHESSQATAAAKAGRSLDQAQADAANARGGPPLGPNPPSAQPHPGYRPPAGIAHAMPPGPERPPEPHPPAHAVGADEPSPGADETPVGADAPTAATGRPFHRAYGLVDCPAEVVVNETFAVRVGLSPTQMPGVSGRAMDFPPLGVKTYSVWVRISAPGFSVAPGERYRHELKVSLVDPYPSTSVNLVAKESGLRLAEPRIIAEFWVDGARVADAIRSLSVVATEGERTRSTDERASTGIDIAAPTGEAVADLTLTIRLSDAPRTVEWTLGSPHPVVDPPDEPLTSEIGGDSLASFLDDLVSTVGADEGKPGIYTAVLGKARDIEVAIPAEVWKALRDVSAAIARPPTILLVSEEAYIPWELAHLDPPLLPDPDPANPIPPFLSAQARIGRWLQPSLLSDGRQRPVPDPPQHKQVARVAVVWGEYSGRGGWKNLAHAAEEADALAKLYGAETIPAAWPEVYAFLKAGGPDLVHFAVHGIWTKDGTDVDGIVLADGHVVTHGDIDARTLAGSPVVFLNACQVAAGHTALGRYSGIAAAFVKAGASCVVAPLWSINDAVAHEVALEFYRRVAAGEPPSEVLRSARTAFVDAFETTSATAMAYQFFGHPEFVVSGLPTGK